MISAPEARGFPAEELPRRDHGFLVGQGDALPGADRGQRRTEAVDPRDRGNDDIGRRVGADLGRPFRTEDHARPAAPEARAQGGGVLFFPQGNEPGAKSADLLLDHGQVRPRGQGRDTEGFGMGGDDGEGVAADRSRRSENGDALHSPLTSRNIR